MALTSMHAKLEHDILLDLANNPEDWGYRRALIGLWADQGMYPAQRDVLSHPLTKIFVEQSINGCGRVHIMATHGYNGAKYLIAHLDPERQYD